MNLHAYLTKNPHPDHILRQRVLDDGTIEFYIHANGVDSDTPIFLLFKNGNLMNKELFDLMESEPGGLMACSPEIYKEISEFKDDNS